ncbi:MULTISPECIES: hypothetical protein [Cupriavidus]
MALEVRYRWALTLVYDAGVAHLLSCDALERALDALTRSAVDAPCPLMLAEVPALCEGYAERVQGWADWRAEQEAEQEAERMADAAEVAERARIDALVAGNDWAALHLPTPEALTASLLAGTVETVREHRLHYEDDVLWYRAVDGRRKRSRNRAALSGIHDGGQCPVCPCLQRPRERCLHWVRGGRRLRGRNGGTYRDGHHGVGP